MVQILLSTDHNKTEKEGILMKSESIFFEVRRSKGFFFQKML